MLSSNLEGVAATSTAFSRQEDQRQKYKCLVIKMYNNGMCSADIIDQRSAAYHVDPKSTIRSDLCIFFDLMGVASVNSYIVYNIMHPNDLTLLDFKTIL